MNYRFLFWVVFFVSAVLFFAPIGVEERVGLGLDKVVHLAIFAGLFYLGDRGYRGDKGNRIKLIILLASYAVGVEFIQGSFIAHRSFDIWDMAAGWLGLFLASLI